MASIQTRSSKRAHVACKACHQRKVRCTIALSGPPCTNCTIDGIDCEAWTRKRRRNPALLTSAPVPETGNETAATPRSELAKTQLSATASCTPHPAKVAELCGDDSGPRLDNGPGFASLDPVCPSLNRTETRGTGLSSTRIGEANKFPSPEAIVVRTPRTQNSPAPSPETSAYADSLEQKDSPAIGVPFYPGDKRGPAFVIDICEPHRSTKSNHSFVSTPSIELLKPEDVDYLRIKGVFSLPPFHVREALIHAYFHHVNIFAPIIDAHDFIPKYEKGQVSLLLLWSMFLASASFLDDTMFSDEFYPTRLALKRASYQKAKILYDMDYERDKITLIQSVFLMSHWYSNTEDRTGPWYWNGIAISLSHTIGLHMLTDSVCQRMKPVWRRLWWAIYGREVWLALGQGRPLRISLEDVVTPMPEVKDNEVPGSSQVARQCRKYLPADLTRLSEIWVRLAKLHRLLGSILTTNYKAKGTTPSISELESTEREIRALYTAPENPHRSPVVAAHSYQFKLYVQTVIIVLYRPFILEGPEDLSPEDQATWRALACQKARAVASEGTSAINSMMSEDLMRFCHTITVLALLSPMQIHLLESTSSKPMSRQIAKHNLALCMLAMGELRKTFLSADAGFKLFEKAREKLDSNESARERENTVTADADCITSDEDNNTESWQMDPESYSMQNSGILSAFWTPIANTFPNGDYAPTFTDAWLDIQNSNWE